MPGDQVDAMMSAGSSRARYTPEVVPILTLIKQLATRPTAQDILVERPRLRLGLHAGPSLGK